MPSSELFFIHQSSDDIVEADVNAEAAGHEEIICTCPRGFVGSMHGPKLEAYDAGPKLSYVAWP